MGAPKKIVPQKNHFCPDCDAKCTGVMMAPAKTMVYFCANGHYHRKGATVKR